MRKNPTLYYIWSGNIVCFHYIHVGHVILKEKILSILKNGPKTFNQLKKELNFKTINQSKELNKNLRDLWNNKKVFFKRSDDTYNLKDTEELIGTFRETKHDYAFVETETIAIFIPGKFVLNALNKDTVKIVLFPLREGDDPDRRAGKVVRVMQRSGSAIIGRVVLKNGIKEFAPDDIVSKHIFSLGNLSQYNEGDILLTKFVDFSNGIVELKLVKILGSVDDAKLDTEIIAYKFDLKTKFSSEVFEKANTIKAVDDIGRRDITDRLIYTIDGNDSKDLDDAVDISILKNGNYKLGVHIADVSHFVIEDSAIDNEAECRGTSTYLVDKVFPMLPPKLSNDLCSLNPNEVKFTLTCDIEITKQGNIVNSEIYESKISSKYRLTYEEVNQLFDNKISTLNSSELTKSLFELRKLANVLREVKLKNGMIDFTLGEAKIKLDNDGNVISIETKKQSVSEKLIEDLMVLTNEIIAETLTKSKLPALFRVHPAPKEENISLFLTIIKSLGYSINKNVDDITSKDFMNFLLEIDGKENSDIIKRYMIQTMEKATYDYLDKGHYALGLKNYLHFTSPIRRYPDLVVHRLIKKYYFDKKANENIFNANNNVLHLEHIAKEASEKERIAVSAERKFVDIKKSRYMKSLVGLTIKGKIVSVVRFGFFVEFDNLVQGLVHIENMKNDEYYFAENSFSIIGKNTKQVYKLGDIVNTHIMSVDIIRGQIDLEVT